MGHSAGAHLVALLIASPELGKQSGLQPYLGSVLLDGAAYNVEKTLKFIHLPIYREAFGNDPAFWRSVSPEHQLKQKTQPILAVCSSKTRERLACPQAQAFMDLATGFGSKASVLSQALPHLDINNNLGLPNTYTESVEAFMRSLGVAL